jgi:putative sporulation protein YyaC
VNKSKHRRRWTLESRKPARFLFPIDRELVWVCVGTDRSTGDSLGPFVGTMLTEAGVPNVYGTLDHPVHALNLAETLERIEEVHPDACIVGIDACLGKAKSVGSMKLRDGALKPGSGVGRVLPSVGDYNIIGVVTSWDRALDYPWKMAIGSTGYDVGGFMEHVVLQNTRLSLVIQMAKSITDFILRSLEARTIEQAAATREQGGLL